MPENLFINVHSSTNDITSRIDLLLAEIRALSLFRSLGCLATFELENIILWSDVRILTWLFAKH